MNNYDLGKIAKIFNLKLITVLVYVVLLGVGIFVYIQIYSAKTAIQKSIVGASSYAPLDIVSGDISPNTADQIINSLGSVIPEKLSWSDINIRPGSYKKDYSINSFGNISFEIGIPKIKTAYIVGIYNQGDTNPQISVSCSLEQPIGYNCNYPIVGGE